MSIIDVKKRLEDYEQMLQYDTQMKTKNKMKDFEVEFEERWEVVKEYFTKELEKNLAQHKLIKIIFQILSTAIQQI